MPNINVRITEFIFNIIHHIIITLTCIYIFIHLKFPMNNFLIIFDFLIMDMFIIVSYD
uniref:Uncharacterized protein n=1 Tax=viral metagenome TaxID=1070528 RepID=A0A6C0H7Q1_9ZZZZ